MLLKTGDMMSLIGIQPVIVTTNSCLKSNHTLVMGAGAAKQLATRIPQLPVTLGQLIKPGDTYGFMYLPHYMAGVFQTKHHWKAPSDLNLIIHSTSMLNQYASVHTHETLNLNFPGIGLGGLPRKAVLPIISTLPDNITVWEYT